MPPDPVVFLCHVAMLNKLFNSKRYTCDHGMLRSQMQCVDTAKQPFLSRHFEDDQWIKINSWCDANPCMELYVCTYAFPNMYSSAHIYPNTACLPCALELYI